MCYGSKEEKGFSLNMRQPETSMEVQKENLIWKGRLLACASTEDRNRLMGYGERSEAVVLSELWWCGLEFYLRGKRGQFETTVLESEFDKLCMGRG